MSRSPSYPTMVAGQSYASSSSSQTLEPSLFKRESDRRRPSASSRSNPSALDSSITRLLVVTKQLLQGLEQWALRNLSEDDVSDTYVKLGNGFELCVATFKDVGISTSELDSVPQDLRECLERALSEDPTTENLNRYLPEIRAIIFKLLNGLKTRQSVYKNNRTNRQPEPVFVPPSAPARPPARVPSGTKAADTLSVRSTASGTSDGSFSASPASINSQLPSRQPSSTALAERSQQRTGLPSRPAPPDAFRSSRAPPRRSPSPQPIPIEPTRHQLVDNPVPVPSMSINKPTPPRPDRFSRDSFGNARPTSRFSLDSDTTNGSPIKSLPSDSPQKRAMTFSMSSSLASLQAGPPTINLPPPAETSPTPAPEALPEVTPETRATLVALQRSDALERRASKRFSSYTFQKMLPGTETKTGSSPQRPQRRSDRAPPLPSLPENLSKSLLALSNETQDVSVLLGPSEITLNGTSTSLTTGISSPSDSSTLAPRSVTPDNESASQHPTPRPGDPQPSVNPTRLPVFLQIGKQVKKTVLELPVELSSLRLLFMEKFEYDPGMEDFPEVYIRDHKTGVQFELEDMEELKEGCVLSLNIEPLDQVKQHFDLTFASLAQEIKEMKTSLTQSRRLSTIMSAPAASSSLLSISPSAHMARQELLRPSSPSPVIAQLAGSPPSTNHKVDLSAQHLEVQNLRRDLGIMRQLHVDFLTETKESFNNLRSQNTSMREIVKTKMGGSRGLLDNSKLKLEAQCQDTIQSVEEISDIIDAAREDAYRRFVSPSKSQMAKIKLDLKKATDMADQFTRDVLLADPTWRATWAFELSRVMEEQRLLAYQNKLSTDLKNDLKDADEMLTNVEAFVVQRQASGPSRTNFRPPSPEANSVPNLLMEIRTKEADPHQRLRAIELQQKAREKELASRQGDEFTNELSGFVSGRKLKKTGGTEEAERIRMRRQDQTLKKMLTGDTSGSGGILSPQPTGGSVKLVPTHTGGGSTVKREARGSSASLVSVKSEKD
ncbi:hypothetical protein P7C73_g4029, partial [Tremellales sp. Uapishka_1]